MKFWNDDTFFRAFGVLLIVIVSMWGLSVCEDAHAIDVGKIYEMPNPSYHNPTLGVAEVGNGGTVSYYPNMAIASHQVKTGPGRLVRVITYGSSTGTIAFFDDGDGTCSSGQMTAAIGMTFIDNSPWEMGLDYTNGLCALVASAADSDVTLVTVP